MAGLAIAADCDLQQDRILIAVDIHFLDRLHLSGRVTLAPEFAARARPVMHDAGGQCPVERCLVHIGHHQDVAAINFRRNTDDEAIRVEFRREG